MHESESSRRQPRIDLLARVQVSSIDPERDPRTGELCFRNSDELCANLSVGGAFIRTADPPAPGHRLLLQIHLPDGESIEAVGRVAWSQRVLGPRGEPIVSGAGVEFIASDGSARGVLERYLDRAARSARSDG